MSTKIIFLFLRPELETFCNSPLVEENAKLSYGRTCLYTFLLALPVGFHCVH